MARTPRIGSLAGIVGAVAVVLVLIVVLSAVHLLPQLRNPFAETTTVRSQPVILKSITQLSRYEAASGSFEVVVDLTKRTSLLPSFLAGSETLFVGQGTDIAYIDFSGLKTQAITVNANRTTVTVALPKAQLEPAVLNVSQSYATTRCWSVARSRTAATRCSWPPSSASTGRRATRTASSTASTTT
jgi:Protein of unknown function (DUF4230)